MAYALRSRLTPIAGEIIGRYQLARRYPLIFRPVRCFANRVEIDDDTDEKPTKYTTSRANIVSAQHAREEATRDDSPWSQTISLGISLAAFLIYFAILREQNDIDDNLYSDISDRVPGFQEVHDKLRAKIVRGDGRPM